MGPRSISQTGRARSKSPQKMIYLISLGLQTTINQPADGSSRGSSYFLIACSAFSIASMQPTTKDARSRFIIFSLPAFSLQNICRTISACRFCATSFCSGLTPAATLSIEKTKLEKNNAVKTRKLIWPKLLLLFLPLTLILAGGWPQNEASPAGPISAGIAKHARALNQLALPYFAFSGRRRGIDALHSSRALVANSAARAALCLAVDRTRGLTGADDRPRSTSWRMALEREG